MDPTVEYTKPQTAVTRWRAAGVSALVALVAALLFAVAPDAAAAEPAVALSPASGPPGTQVTVAGQNWPPGHTISIAFPDRGFWGPGSTTVGPDGSFTLSFAWPSPANLGDHQVAVIDNTGPVNGPSWPTFTVTPGEKPQETRPDPTAPAVTVDRTYVADAKWAEAAQFSRGDLVRYQIVISARGDATVNARMRIEDQDGRAIFDGGSDVRVSPRAGSVFFESTIPSDARPGTYTERATVTYNGATTVQTNPFEVRSDVNSRLKVPFATQIGTAGNPNNGGDNCGPASIAMAIRFYGGSSTVEQAALAIRDGVNGPGNGPTDFKGASSRAYLAKFSLTERDVATFDQVRAAISAGHPVIILVNNEAFRGLDPPPYQNDNDGWFTEGHILVITGLDAANVYVNDPLRNGPDYVVPSADFANAASSARGASGVGPNSWYAASIERS